MQQVAEALFPLALLLIGAVPGYAVGEIIYRLLNVFMSRQKTLARFWKRVHGPGVLAAALGLGLAFVQGARTNDPDAATTFTLMVAYWLVVCAIWAGIVVLLTFVEWLYYRRGMRLAQFDHARYSRAQITTIVNILPIVSGFAILALGLTTYNAWHQFSETAIAIGATSAVFVGIVGIGAMGNVVAGVIASASGVVAEGDVVELTPGEAGRVREITLTHAKIAISDEKEISVPLSRFATGQLDILKRTQPSLDDVGRNPFRLWNQARKRSSDHVSKTWVSWEMDIGNVPWDDLRDEIAYWFDATSQAPTVPQPGGNQGQGPPLRPRAKAATKALAEANAAVNNAAQPSQSLLQRQTAARTAANTALTTQQGAQQGLNREDYKVRMATVGMTNDNVRVRLSIKVKPGDLGAEQIKVREWITGWLREHAEVRAEAAADQQKVLDAARAAALNAKATTQGALLAAIQTAQPQAVQNAVQQAVQPLVQQATIQTAVQQAAQHAVQAAMQHVNVQTAVQQAAQQAVQAAMQQVNVQTAVTTPVPRSDGDGKRTNG